MADELSTPQERELRADLGQLVRSLTSLLEGIRADAGPVDLDQPIGRLSRMDAIQQAEMAKASKAQAEIRLRQCRAAMQRIESDEYGLCLDCDEPIGFRRLKAKPETPFCVRCQARAEKA